MAFQGGPIADGVNIGAIRSYEKVLNPIHVRDHVIRPTLQHLGLWSKAAENLLLGTALVESGLRHLVQLGGGPALGLYQMEPATHDDIWKNYLAYRNHYLLMFKSLSIYGGVDSEEMTWNIRYATAMARVHYLRDPQRLPAHNDLKAMARLWKRVYNTELGKGTPQKYIDAWNTAMGV